MASLPHEPPAPDWWTGAVGYEVYLRSFNDTTGNGVGDLTGLRERLPYLADLGVDYLWVTPFYPSPQADHGYDVADHTGVDPVYGTLDDFDRMLRDAHAVGLRVIIDLVPNHTSDRHPWFRDATRSRGADKRDYYVWRDPRPDGRPPNNWVSKFGGPAWTFHEPTRQYYMHTFLPEQPDLNWANPRVREAFDDILLHWLERGVDGFRIDTAHLLTEDPHFRDNPQVAAIEGGADPETVYASFEHRHDLDQPDVTDVFRRWRHLAEPYGALLLGEVVLMEPERLQRYVADGALHLAFYFPALKTRWDALEIRGALTDAALVQPGRFAWPLSSHDDPRAADRFGGGSDGARRALAYLTLLAGLPGSSCLLQGDELGLSAGTRPAQGHRDALVVRNPGAAGRDRSRTPMPWRPGQGFGFSDGPPWLDFPETASDRTTAAEQERDPNSPLRRTRELFAQRRRLPDLCGTAPFRWRTDQGNLIAYQRGTTVVAMNPSDTGALLRLAGDFDVCFVSAGEPTESGNAVVVPPDAAVIVRQD